MLVHAIVCFLLPARSPQVDATMCGGAARFINHSCEVCVLPVFAWRVSFHPHFPYFMIHSSPGLQG